MDLSLSVPEHRAVLEAWFHEVEHGDIPAERVPWARLGWFDRTTAWIEEQIARLGYGIDAPIDQLHARVWSTILRVPTSSGMLYFKASGPSFAYEPPLTQTLSAHWPACIPHVIAVDKEQSWLLMKDAGRPLRELLLTEDKLSNIVYLERALSLYAQFQIETAAYRDTLLSLGCPDRRLHILPLLFEHVVADTPVLLLGRKGGVSNTELEQLRNFTLQVQRMCDELASYNLPETLHHDDFHTRNILVNQQGYVFFDWGDAAITHPFFSMFIALRSAKYRLQYDDDSLLRLCDAYLEPWGTYAPKAQLLAAFQLAQRLAILSRALTWYQIVSSLEERVMWEYEDAVPYWLKIFLTNEEPGEC
ncbi:MAG: phosphotransferase [Ktedonobacteraceae bacterium]